MTVITNTNLELESGVQLLETARRVKFRRTVLFGDDSVAIQREAITALSKIAARVRLELARGVHRDDVAGNCERKLTGLSLDALLATWSEAELWRLIDSEGMRGLPVSSCLVVHVIAANTPLLAWSSVARALLIGAGSMVRLPRGSAEIDYWANVFHAALSEASPELSELVEYCHWSSKDIDATRHAVRASDCVVVYGSDQTVDDIQALCSRGQRFVGYGHRFSLGVVEASCDYAADAEGMALDMLIFDQQGCLSPQIIFVVGDLDASKRFADRLAARLAVVRDQFPKRTAAAAASIRGSLTSAQFRAGTTIRHDGDFAWSIVESQSADPEAFGSPGTVTISSIVQRDDLGSWLARHKLAGRLQGVSWCGEKSDSAAACTYFAGLGASYVCRPGHLQRPPFFWREDNLDLLRSLTGH